MRISNSSYADHYNNDQPIYLQIAEQLELLIICDRYHPGERLPSTRELALIAKVNPNTMQRALAELETTGLIRVERTAGRYVTTDVDLIDQSYNNYIFKKTEDFIADMQRLGINRQSIIKLLKNYGD